ncbi:MAG: rane fusion protein copper/silver efflux system [Thermoanaerobaculia bacterium]|jgi:Cu(I)/Ag(I) efflux system membrane fusion protein|nr:rane fusion protein copper/silver efflux system [Thermoanaerobaculia bacterium]
MKRALPWLLALLLAVALAIVVLNKKSEPSASDPVTQDGSGKHVSAWIDPMYSMGPPHVYKSNRPGIAPDCGMKLVPVYDDAAPADTTTNVRGYSGVTVSEPKQQLIGVKLAIAELRNLGRTTRAAGRIALDERRVAQVHTKLEGIVETLNANFVGQPVRRGDPLLSLYSADLLATQNELLLAQRNKSDLGRTLAASARTRLRLWDMSDADIDRVARSGKPMRDVVLRSPVTGVVLAKSAVLGARAIPSDTLFEIGDLSHVWVLADVYESDLASLRVGTPAQVVVAGQTLPTRVTFIGPMIAAQTRTANVRLELENPNGLLKPDMYADVILQQPIGNVIAVPDSAVMNTGTRSVVFVAGADGAFEPRGVVTGAKVQGFYEIRSGLAAGERVVTDANFLVDSESRLKSAISKTTTGGTP